MHGDVAARDHTIDSINAVGHPANILQVIILEMLLERATTPDSIACDS
jgi:hypothetical protein